MNAFSITEFISFAQHHFGKAEDRVEKAFHSAQHYLAIAIKDLLDCAWADNGIKDLIAKIDRQSASV